MKNYIKKYNLLFNDEFIKYIDVSIDLYKHLGIYEDIPKVVLFLDIEPIIAIHSFDYFIGKTATDKRIADKNLKINMLKVINMHSKWMKFFRRSAALSIYHKFSITCWEEFKNARLF